MGRKRRKHQPQREIVVHRRAAPGSSPGLVLPDPSHPRPVIHVMAYGPGSVVERDIATADEAFAMVGQRPVTWINVEGLGDAATIERFGELFGLHRLALEDTVNVHQRAKVEDYGEVLFIVLRMVHCGDEEGRRCSTEQISLFLGPNWLLTFQEGQPGDSFNRVRSRLREKGGRMTSLGGDYLAYALIDAAIDNYYPALEVYAEWLDELEDLVLDARGVRAIDELHEVKADLLVLRRAIWPLRDAMALLAREETTRFSEATRPYLRDCYDHIVQVVELVETYRELSADLRDLYMSSLSNRINDTMRVLTIISTLFIPLTFIAGVYGMNFDNMPELHWSFGYPLALGSMLLTAVSMLIFFYRQGWILKGRNP
jgi:magnesium transporter